MKSCLRRGALALILATAALPSVSYAGFQLWSATLVLYGKDRTDNNSATEANHKITAAVIIKEKDPSTLAFRTTTITKVIARFDVKGPPTGVLTWGIQTGRKEFTIRGLEHKSIGSIFSSKYVGGVAGWGIGLLSIGGHAFKNSDDIWLTNFAPVGMIGNVYDYVEATLDVGPDKDRQVEVSTQVDGVPTTETKQLDEVLQQRL